MTEPPARHDALDWREALRTIAIAFGYFTRLPVPSSVVFTEARLARSGRYFPLVGALVGVIGALVFGIGCHFWPVPVAVLLSMVATLLATGALHEDGLADCCDAFGGGYRRADVLRILKDSRIGVFGGIGLVMMLALKWQTLVGLAAWGPGVVCGWMIVAHAASRAGAIVFTATLDYARASIDANAETSDSAEPTGSDAKARPFQRNNGSDTDGSASRNGAGIALLIGLPGLFWHGVALGATLIVAGALLHWALGRWWQRRIGGYTGDCLGLAQQLFEVGIYLLVLGWISS